MTLRKIARMGHPVLLARAAEVDDPASPEMRRLAADMIETMRDSQGIGIAAPQVHEGVRLIIAQPPPLAGAEPPEPMVLFNPELTPAGEERDSAFEGCLSIPGLRGLVPRWRRVAWRAVDSEGAPVGGVAEGLFARILQHEVDHLDGILFTMRMTDLRQLAFERELELLKSWHPEPAIDEERAV
ncbi:MAG TPA: peptide deformylase [Geminicoccaceae bacterium]|nr:peptide deformylase [Geminicoccus sp.]HMU48849.1 peptide deformylase [Geminicoccaceae bacterium]